MTTKKIGRPRSMFLNSGDRMGMFTAIKQLSGEVGKPVWLLQCDCGEFSSRRLETLRFVVRNNGTPNCGCYTREARSRSGRLNFEHGLSVSDRRLYDVHRQMLQRCQNSESKDFPCYGARGISVCDAWHDPREFFEWAYSSGYERGLTIERVDVNGNYEPGNCTWIVNELQGHNTRRNVRVTINGETLHLAAWVRRFGVKWPTVSNRLKRGWSIERALQEPAHKRGVA